jgi:hypothetical protein
MISRQSCSKWKLNWNKFILVNFLCTPLSFWTLKSKAKVKVCFHFTSADFILTLVKFVLLDLLISQEQFFSYANPIQEELQRKPKLHSLVKYKYLSESKTESLDLVWNLDLAVIPFAVPVPTSGPWRFLHFRIRSMLLWRSKGVGWPTTYCLLRSWWSKWLLLGLNKCLREEMWG